jgi:hypothetical protein
MSTVTSGVHKQPSLKPSLTSCVDVQIIAPKHGGHKDMNINTRGQTLVLPNSLLCFQRNDSFGHSQLKAICDVIGTSSVESCLWSQSKSHVPPPPSCTPRLHLQNQQLKTCDKEKGAMTSKPLLS